MLCFLIWSVLLLLKLGDFWALGKASQISGNRFASFYTSAGTSQTWCVTPLLFNSWTSAEQLLTAVTNGVGLWGGHRRVKEYQKITKFILLVTPRTTYELLPPEEVAFMSPSSLPLWLSKVCVLDVWLKHISGHGHTMLCRRCRDSCAGSSARDPSDDDAKMLAAKASLTLDRFCQQVPSPSKNTWA